VFLAPFLVFYPRLRALKLKALMEYGALTGRHGRLVDRKWIHGEPVDDKEDPLLDSPELGLVVDVNSIYQAVAQMRFVPLGKRNIIAAASLLPFLPVYAIQVPIRDMVAKIAGALFQRRVGSGLQPGQTARNPQATSHAPEATNSAAGAAAVQLPQPA
jgi:hypothetical protein